MAQIIEEVNAFNDASYIFNSVINNLVVDFAIKWNTEALQWSCNIVIENGKEANGFALVSGIDMLSQLNFPFAFYCVDDSALFSDPTRESLGVNHRFIFVYEAD